MGRFVLDDVLTSDECLELIHLHHTNAVPGYRPNYSLFMMRELVSSPFKQRYLIPLIKARDKVLNLVEDLWNCSFNVYFEWTGVVCWHPESFIGVHYDANRDYLKQRHVSVIVYLNDYALDFEGGVFQFYKKKSEKSETNDPSEKNGEEIDLNSMEVEEEVYAKRGRAVLFGSGDENIHGVTKITKGCRFTLTLWFTMNTEESEDQNILKYLPLIPSPNKETISSLEHNIDNNNNNDNVWDLQKEKMEFFGLQSLKLEDKSTEDFCVSVISDMIEIPFKFQSAREAIELASFFYWMQMRKCLMEGDKRAILSLGLLVKTSLEDLKILVESWKNYNNTLYEKYCKYLPKWHEMGLLYEPES